MAITTYQRNNKKCYEVYVQGRDPRGKRIQKRAKLTSSGQRISSEQTAKRIEYQLKREIEAIAKGTCLWTWKKWHEECIRRMILTFRKGTVNTYDEGLKKWLPKEWIQREMTDFQKVDVHHLIFEELGEKLSPIGKKNNLTRIHRIFEMALDEGIILKNPARGIKVKVPQKDKRVLSMKEANKLLQEAKRGGHRHYPIWAFALLTGMRMGELYAVRHSDIDFDSGLIHVTKQFTPDDGLHETKGNQNRVVPISNELCSFLMELMKCGGVKETLWKWTNDQKSEKGLIVLDDLLLPRQSHAYFRQQGRILKAFCRSLGITEIRFHDLRASFITHMLSQGVAINVVMKIVGHNQMSTTDKYNRLAGVEIKGSTNKLGYLSN